MLVRVNVTDERGVLLGQIDLDADDLRHPQSIGAQVVEQLPAHMRPELLPPREKA